MPLITIVTVCYNVEDTIVETMKTILEQDYPAIEYIVIDGGSSDRTLEKIRQYASLFLQHNISFRYISEPDHGIYDAMNKGIRMAEGEWINFMNSGDGFYRKDVLSTVFSQPIGKEEKVVYGNTVLRLAFGEVEMLPKPIDYMRKKMAFCHQSVFVRTELMKGSLFNLSYRFAADYDFFYHYYKRGGAFKYINRAISYFESEEGTSSRNRLKVNKEYACIQGIDKTVKWKIKFAFKVFRVKLKEGLQSVFPKKYVNRIRERNYRRIVKHRQS